MRQPNLRSRAGNASARPKRVHPEHLKVKLSPENAGGRPQQPAPQEEKATTVEAQVDTSRADGVMLLLSPAIDKKTIRWKEHLKGRLIQASLSWHGARVHVLVATYGLLRKVYTKTRRTGPNYWAHWPRRYALVAGGRLQRPAACQPELGRPLQHSQGKYGGQGRILPTICGVPQTGGAQYMEQRSWSHLCTGRRTNSNRLHLHLPQLVPRASEASQASPSVGIGWVEEGRAYPNSCGGTASPALESPQRIAQCSFVLRLLSGGGPLIARRHKQCKPVGGLTVAVHSPTPRLH